MSLKKIDSCILPVEILRIILVVNGIDAIENIDKKIILIQNMKKNPSKNQKITPIFFLRIDTLLYILDSPRKRHTMKPESYKLGLFLRTLVARTR
jgi:hypothetical protein